MNRLSKKILIALSLTMLVVLVIISVFYAGIRVSPSMLKRIAEERLAKATGEEVSIESASVRVFVQPDLTLLDVRIGTPGELYMTAKRIDAEISPWQLLLGRTPFRAITFHQPGISLNNKILRQLQGKQEGAQWPSITIVDGRLDYTHGDSKPILKEVNGLVGPDEIDLTASVLTGSAQITARFHNGWKGRISTENLDLSSLRGDLTGICTLDARFDLTGRNVNASLTLDTRGLAFPWQDEPLERCSIGIRTKGTFDHAVLTEVSLKTPVAELAGSGEIIDLQRKKDAVLRLDMTSTDFDYEQVVRLLPTQTFYPWLKTLLTEQIRGGSSRFSTIKCNGTLQKLFDAETFLDNVRIVQNLAGQSFGAGHDEDRITDITGSVIYTEGSIALMGLNGLMGESIIENVDLTFHEIAQSGLKITVDVNADMPSDDFVRAWRAAMVSEEEYQVLSPVSRVTHGRLRGHVRTYWDETSGSPMQASGNISLEALDFSWGDTVIRNLNGTVQAQDFNAPLDIALSGTANELAMEYFRCTLHDPFGTMKYSFSLKADQPIQTEGFSLTKGSAVIMEGTGDGPDMQAAVSVRSNGFTLLNSTYATRGKPIMATGSLKGNLWPEPEFSLTDLRTQLPSGDVLMAGRFTKSGGDLDIKGSLDLKQFTAVTDSREHSLSGMVAGDMYISWGKTLSLTGSIVCNEATICADGSTLVLNGPLQMRGNTLTSKSLSIASQDIRIQITSGLLTLAKRPHFSGVLLIEGVKLTPQESRIRELLESIDGEAPVELINLDLYGIPVERMKAYVELKDGVLDLSSLYLEGPSGSAHGSTTILPAGNSTFDMFISLDDANIRQFLSALNEKEPWIRGTMDLEGHLRGNTGSINGTMVLTARDGKIQKYALFSRIFALLNVYKIIQSRDIELTSKNFPYNVISSTFTLDDSIISFDDFYFDSNSLQISAVGTYSLKTSQIDSIFGVQPFESFDRAIGMIPLLGWILTGDDNKLFVLSLKVQGDIDDPSVQIAPVDTLSTPVKNSLVRALEFSSDLIRKSQKLLPGEKD